MMKVRCKVLGIGERFPASDGSVLPKEVLLEYLNSDTYAETVRQKSMVSSLTHRCRNLSAVFPDKPALKQTIGKDDSMLIVNESSPTPTHYVEKLYINEEDGWLWADLVVLDENLFDDVAKQNIMRLKGLLRSGIKVHTSAVIVAYWSNQKNGIDLCKKIQEIRGVDVTFNSSWKDYHIEEIIEDDEQPTAKEFSEVSEIVDFEGKEGIAKVNCFSNLSDFNITAPKSSKIDNQFTILKAKSFSCINPIDVEKDNEEVVEQKEFSQAHIIERTRLGKLSPRIRFRRLIMDYRQALKSQGGPEKISPETLKIMKSLFTTDLIGIMQEITGQVLSGKNINALLGASALSAQIRKSCQEIQVPYRMAFLENKKQGFVSKVRYQKIQEAYQKFTKAILDYVFNTPTSQTLIKEDEEDKENG